jgi:hypothetical protein
MRHFEFIDKFPVEALRSQLAAHPELWDQHSVRKTAPGTPHSRMSDIWVRYNDETPFAAAGNYSAFNDRHVPIWYEAYEALPALKPIILALMAKVGGEMLGGVLITRIPPGESIEAHTDRGWHVDYFEKFYVSVQSDRGAVFGCFHDGVDELLEPKPGQCWLFDNHKLHWVQNDSKVDRITLIVCIRRAP